MLATLQAHIHGPNFAYQLVSMLNALQDDAR